MKVVLAFFFVLALPVMANANSLDETRKWNSEKIAWLSFDDGAMEAKRSGRPIFMIVHATWCPQCRKYRKQFFDETIVELSRKFVMVLVDGDKNPATQ